MRLFQLEDCQVFAAPVAGPCFVDGATGCTLHVAARQIRVHRATETAFHLRMLSRPVIEECRALRFAPLGEGEAEAAYDGAADALKEAGMGEPTAQHAWAAPRSLPPFPQLSLLASGAPPPLLSPPALSVASALAREADPI